MRFAVVLNSAAACEDFLESEDPSTIACQLRADEEACSPGKADFVATELCPETAKYSRSIKMVQYSGIVGSIKAYLAHMTHEHRLENLPSVGTEKPKYHPPIEDYETALKVLNCIKNEDGFRITASTPLEDIVKTLEDSLKTSSSGYQDHVPQVPIKESMPSTKSQKKCYICQFWLVTPHPQYQSLCKPCGDFNLASSNLSLSPNLQLVGKTALVTGARIHLGFHTALRLLRSGAKVIISSRYPRNAALRYLAESDASNWRDSLRIIGADFRAARDVFELVECVKEILKEWGMDGVGKLDILVNNAAQTWTDSIQKEQEAIEQEKTLGLERSASHCKVLVASDYLPRVRGGTQESEPLITLSQLKEQIAKAIHNTPDEDKNIVTNMPMNGNTSIAVQTPSDKCSWFQTLPEIPYEDIISAHSVNTFVPLILIRELLPLMGTTRSQSPLPLRTTPRAHIINVSAREGMFEANPKSKHKNGYHVHTNLTKAALNMLTETEAWPTWRERRVAMNSVDPGYLSMPLEMEERGKECPIGWEDGAGRVLWPVAVGERGEAVWGRFLKDYGAYHVDVGAGR
ncbi:Uncharacterized protein LOCC1_G001654 [Lachnellula occidentalis]|uniref:Oxidoreductase n=1 Tax=Lachnellula occidentalis TaxID=215460 RepID=A0A8H8S8E8_9HELO|nr:Uncharacterized protein LOCC1_G001654 [Lachnellula occidentalis]